MATKIGAKEALDREFLGIRSRLLDVAAALDRVARAQGIVGDDPRLERIQRCLGVLSGEQAGRAEEIQMIFSIPYREQWRREFGLES